MRIIAGEFRSRRILPPQGNATRPITDRVKQSLFDLLGDRLEDAVVYDCFAGTGSLGLESLSRGARHATFFELDRAAVSRLRQNIVTLGVTDRSTVNAGDLFKWFSAAPPPVAQASLVFLDPPYRFLGEKPQLLQSLGTRLYPHLHREGLIIFRHSTEDALSMPGARVEEIHDYGSMRLEFLSKE